MNRPTDHNLADRHLVETVLNGNAHAFGQIIRNTEGLVAQMVFRMVNNPSDHPDIVQDVYLKAFKNLSGFKFQAKLSTWIGQITYNTCLNYLEKKKLVLVGPVHNEDEEGADGKLERLQQEAASLFWQDVSSTVSAKQRTQILQAAIEQLSPLYKTLITLYHQEELSYAEIVQVTSLPEGTIKSYLFRARKALKEILLSGYKKEEL